MSLDIDKNTSSTSSIQTTRIKNYSMIITKKYANPITYEAKVGLQF